MALAFVPTTRNNRTAWVATLSPAALRRWYHAAVEARQLSAARKVVAYLHSLDDQRLKDIGIARPEIALRFGPRPQTGRGRCPG